MKKNTYFAILHLDDGGWFVRFPDVPGAITEGETVEEAHAMAIDALSAILVTGRLGRDYSTPRTYKEIAALTEEGELVFPIVATEEAMEEYRPKKRVNIMVPVDLLEEIDAHVKTQGLNRSRFLCEAAKAAL